MLVLRQQRFKPMTVAATLLGFAGVAVLLSPNGRQHFGLIPCLAILAGTITWSLGSVLTRSMDLPSSRPLTAGAAMMLGGSGLLVLSAGFGEMHSLPDISLRGGVALAYLIVCGSLLAFTAYVWLLAHLPATRVASHAYVNPIVAVALGYFVAGEVITTRTLVGTALVLTSVFLILRKDKKAG
jgi:drug/metabolite transporter (DMT)-like permease